jgi:hypothetical protein
VGGSGGGCKMMVPGIEANAGSAGRGGSGMSIVAEKLGWAGSNAGVTVGVPDVGDPGVTLTLRWSRCQLGSRNRTSGAGGR